MTLVFVAFSFFAVGFEFKRWWTVALPALLGALAAIAIAAGGHGLGDTPIPFLIVIGTIANVAGIVIHKPIARSASK